MKIVQVEYRRLRTFGDYQNETVGAVAQVEDGEDSVTALYTLRAWVDQQMGDRSEQRELTQRVTDLRWQAEDYERKVARADKRWRDIIAFLEKLGIERPADIPEDLSDLPF